VDVASGVVGEVAGDAVWRPALRRGEVLVWVLPLDGGDEAADLALLDDAERMRAARFRDALHRRRWTAARAGLRRVLGACTGAMPAAVAFAHDRGGRPRLATPGAPRFSFTHSGALALCAVALDGEVGVDAELRAPDVEVEPLARLLGAAEPGGAVPSRDALFDAWARLEARAKCLGLSLDDAIAATADPARRPPGWEQVTVVPLAVAAEYAAAVAVWYDSA